MEKWFELVTRMLRVTNTDATATPVLFARIDYEGNRWIATSGTVFVNRLGAQLVPDNSMMWDGETPDEALRGLGAQILAWARHTKDNDLPLLEAIFAEGGDPQ